MADSKSDDPIAAITAQVNELYRYSTKVFLSDKTKKNAKLEADRDAVVAAIKALPADVVSANQVTVLYLHGKALDVVANYVPEAEELLSKAAKLDPARIDAWNCLGNCFWKKGDLVSAKNCFVGALGQSKNPESLRQLSMLLRQLGASPAERLANTKESLTHAKAAVALNVDDGVSWYVLGNAYLAVFFASEHNPEDLVHAIKAYTQAETKDPGNPDLYYNRATVYQFLEDYKLAVQSFQKASEIDPALTAVDDIDGIKQHVKRVVDAFTNKGRLKPKKLRALADSMPVQAVKNAVQESKDAEGRTFVKLTELADGPNPGKMLILKMLMTCIRTRVPPLCLIMLDEDTNTMPLSLYHLTEASCDRFGERDVFIVLDPIVKVVEYVDDDGNVAQYRSVHILHPNKFYVNGRSVSGAFAHEHLQISTMAM